MLSNEHDGHCEKVMIILGILQGTRPPEHANLDEVLGELSSPSILDELFSDTQFTMAPILKTLHQWLDGRELRPQTLASFARLFDQLGEQLDRLDSAAQREFISVLMQFLHSHGAAFVARCDDADRTAASQAHVAVDGVFKRVFMQCCERGANDNLRVFVDKCATTPDIDLNLAIYGWRNYARVFGRAEGTLEERLNEMAVVFLTGMLDCARRIHRLLPEEAKSLVHVLNCILLVSRQGLKCGGTQGEHILSHMCATAALIADCSIAEIRERQTRFLADALRYFCEKPQVFATLVQCDGLHGFELHLLRGMRIDTSPVLRECLLVVGEKQMRDGKGGVLLATAPDAGCFYDTFMRLLTEKVSSGTLADREALLALVARDQGVLLLDVLGHALPQAGSDGFIDVLLELYSSTQFSSAHKQRVLLHSLLRLALMSRTSDALGDYLKRRLQECGGLMSTANLSLVASFPFSLWRSLARNEMVAELLSELLFGWKMIAGEGESSEGADVLFLLVAAVGNIVRELPDAVRSEGYKQLLGLLNSTMVVVRTNAVMAATIRHRLGAALQVLLRAMLLLRDDRVYDVLDQLTKLAGIESCVPWAGAWMAVPLLPFVRHARDGEKLTRFVSERFEMLVTKLLGRVTGVSPGTRLLLQHHIRHSLYLFSKYTSDVAVITRPFLETEADALIVYAQGFPTAWSKGGMDAAAEDAVWRFLHGQRADAGRVRERAGSVVTGFPRRTASGGPSAATSQLLKDDIYRLQRLVEELTRARNDTALTALHSGIVGLLGGR